ncbi:hypothetical protein [Cystobacter ferrugineus]|nr:hypothetical protein [Cystobacter ferrugineus]
MKSTFLSRFDRRLGASWRPHPHAALLAGILCLLLMIPARSGAYAYSELTPPTHEIVSGSDRGLNDPAYITNSIGGASDLNSINMHMLSLIARGDIAGAGEYYLLATGASQVPRWFATMQQAFNASNQAAGRCEGVANNVAEGFRKLGQNPQIVRVFGNQGRFLSWRGQKMVSDNNFHVAVLNDGKIVDAYTGPAGMTWAEYQVAMQTLGKLEYKVLP